MKNEVLSKKIYGVLHGGKGHLNENIRLDIYLTYSHQPYFFLFHIFVSISMLLTFSSIAIIVVLFSRVYFASLGGNIASLIASGLQLPMEKNKTQ